MSQKPHNKQVWQKARYVLSSSKGKDLFLKIFIVKTSVKHNQPIIMQKELFYQQERRKNQRVYQQKMQRDKEQELAPKNEQK